MHGHIFKFLGALFLGQKHLRDHGVINFVIIFSRGKS